MMTREPDLAPGWLLRDARLAESRMRPRPHQWKEMKMSRDYPITHDEHRWIQLWRRFGGDQHGPNVEHVTMPYERFFEFCAEIEKPIARRDTLLSAALLSQERARFALVKEGYEEGSVAIVDIDRIIAAIRAEIEEKA